MKRIGSIIFDMSGVLFDDICAVWKTNSDAFEACGKEKIESVEKFKESFKLPIREFYKTMRVTDGLMPRLQREFRRAYPKYSGYIRIFPEVQDILEKLKKQGMMLAIVSNTPSLFLIEHLEKAGIRKFFDAATGQEDCKEQKPSPVPILITLERIGAKPQNSAYVGDMEEEIMAGKQAGAYTFAINRANGYHPGWKLKRHDPDFFCYRLERTLHHCNNARYFR